MERMSRIIEDLISLLIAIKVRFCWLQETFTAGHRVQKFVSFHRGRFQPLPLVTLFQGAKGTGKIKKWDWAKVFPLTYREAITVKSEI